MRARLYEPELRKRTAEQQGPVEANAGVGRSSKLRSPLPGSAQQQFVKAGPTTGL